MRPHLYKRPCPSVGWSVRRSVGNAFVKIDKKRILNDFDSAGQGKKREGKDGGTGRKERRGERKKLLK